MAVTGVIVALERSFKAFYLILEDLGAARAIVVEEVDQPVGHADETPDVGLLDFLSRRSGYLQTDFLIGLITADVIVFYNRLGKCLV